MSTAEQQDDPIGSVGSFPMAQETDASAVIQAGFEFGCPGADHHLGLRFFNQPGTAVDGTAFPATTARAAGRMLLPMLQAGLPLELTGLASPPPPPTPPADPSDAAALGVYAALLEAYATELADAMVASPVTACWYVMHDTGGAISVSRPPDAARGAHVFIGHGPDTDETVSARYRGVYLCNDYAAFRQATTKFEWRKHHPEFRGKMLHNELLNTNTTVSANPTDTYTDFQYDCAAWSYLCASMRAGAWLTVTCHLEVDRGIPGGHCDPRNFDFARLYAQVAHLAGVSASATFGILPERIGDNMNQAAYMNTFPAQYGPVRNETRLRKTSPL